MKVDIYFFLDHEGKPYNDTLNMVAKTKKSLPYCAFDYKIIVPFNIPYNGSAPCLLNGYSDKKKYEEWLNQHARGIWMPWIDFKEKVYYYLFNDEVDAVGFRLYVGC